MKKKSPLYFFLFGILFYEIIFPILSDLANVILGFCQLAQGKQAVKMTKYNEAVEKYKEEQAKKDEPIQTFAMGFHVPSNTDDEEEEDDE